MDKWRDTVEYLLCRSSLLSGEILLGSWAFITWPVILFLLTVRWRRDAWRTVLWIAAFWVIVIWGLLRWGVDLWGVYVSPLTLFLLFLGGTYLLVRRRALETAASWTVMAWILLQTQEVFFRLFASLGPGFDRWVIPWHRLPRAFGLPVLIGIRERLRSRNLYNPVKFTSMGKPNPSDLATRTNDGSFNNLENPRKGMVGTPFGRNMPGKASDSSPGEPNPRLISLKLMTREKFEAATSLNLLAAAWIQFMVHDWFLHKNREASLEDQKVDPCPAHMIEMPLPAGDDWPPGKDGFRLRVPYTGLKEETATDENGAPIYKNYASHWWDASQLYGDADVQKQLRSERHGKPWLLEDRPLPQGKLWISKDSMLPLNKATGRDLAGFDKNWWLGLNLMHTLFTLEHNAICDRLHEAYPSWSDDELFARARLINAGLIAKIHTVDWTPAILHHPTVITGMRGNWWGILGRQVRRNFGRLFGVEDEVFSGILGSKTDDHGVPYALTEEFVSVYRMHPLLRDDFCFCSAKDGNLIRGPLKLREVLGDSVCKIRAEAPMIDLLYSFGVAHPGAITLGNYPGDLQELQTQDEVTADGQKQPGLKIDLAAVDILRDRERGLPRYNDFRKGLGLRRIRSFRALTKRFDPAERKKWREKLKDVYDHVDQVDLMVGLFSEKPPKGFGFSDTAFRIFILMASRRLKSDRFFTTDYRPEVYTQVGLDWIENNDMSTVLVRHFPGLRPFLSGLESAFKPWPLVEQLREISSQENKFPVHKCFECE